MIKKISLLLCIFCSISWASFSQHADIDKIINSIKENYAPDKRVVIFDVNQKKTEASNIITGKISDYSAYIALINELKTNNIAFIDSLQILPEHTIGLNHWSIVPLSAIYIRSQPNFSTEITTQATLGTPVRILDSTRSGWTLLQTPDKYIGWTDASFDRMNRSALSAYNARDKVIVTDLSTMIYSKPSVQSQRVMEVLIGNILTRESKNLNKKFTSVSLPDGTKGFVLSKSIKNVTDWSRNIDFSGEAIVETGKQFLGLPYLWGGTCSRGFDCSGFTKTVFFLHGLILPRDASQQFDTGDKVDISNGYEQLKKGDLLFFGKKTASNPDKYSVVHVGIYMGNRLFIHSSEMVRINSLDPASPDYDAYNHQRLIGATRIVGSSMKNLSELIKNDWYN